jgi:hypothetical protein
MNASGHRMSDDRAGEFPARGAGARGRGGLVVGLAACLVAVASAGTAHAYVRTTTERTGLPMKWSDPAITLSVYHASPPLFLNEEQVLAAARASAAAWSVPQISCTSLLLQVLPVPEPDALVEADRKNRVTFRRRTWCKEPRVPSEPCYDPAALAITSVFAQVKDGRIIDADVEVNGVNFRWADVAADQMAGMARPNTQDLQNVLTHEFGHLIGLDHTCYVRGSDRPRPRDHTGQFIPDCGPSAPQKVRDTTMYASAIPGDIDKRSLEADDIKAACDIYPSGEADRGGCAMGGGRTGGGAAGAWLLLGLLPLVRRRRDRG